MTNNIISNTNKVGLYKNMRSTTCYEVDVRLVLDGIKEGKWEQQVSKYRESKDSVIKENLPCFTVGGVFTPTKSAENLKSFSNLMSLDVDDLEISLESIIDELIDASKNSIYSIFRSTSNNGLCILVNVVDIDSLQQFKRLYEGLYNNLNKVLGSISKFDHLPNINRLRYVSFDPSLYVNEDCEKWSEEEEVEEVISLPVPKSSRTVQIKLGSLTDEEKIREVLIKYEEVAGSFGGRGTRHDWILGLGRWACRADVDENALISYCVSNFTNNSRPEVWNTEIKRCIKDSYRAYQSERGNYEVTKKFSYDDILTCTNVEEVRNQLFMLIGDKLNYGQYLRDNKKSDSFIQKEIKFLKTINNYL